jgi:succinate-semialdehyde dehydrogenase/glutarate-semialdehyde dehydrogenase
MNYATINPYNNQLIKEFPFDSFPDLTVSQKAFQLWRKLSIAERAFYLKKVAILLEKRKEEYAKLITLEMGKPLRESLYELNKTIVTFDYYIENAERFLANEEVGSNASKSYIRFEPLGIIFSIMPWNFPFWQVFRFAIPTLIAGNVSILKHATNVPQCAAAIASLFEETGFPIGIFRNYFLTNEDAARLIAHDSIAGVSFTGSDATGSIVAGLAGKYIKKCVVELGGNDPFIVLEDANIDTAVEGAIKARSINSGQSCNGAKRFIVLEKVYDDFVQKLINKVREIKVGNPLLDDTQTGPLARLDLAEKVQKQIQLSIKAGAMPHFHSYKDKEEGNFVAPLVLTDVKPGMAAFEEEIFAAVWSVVKVKNVEEAIALANQSQYGLGASIWTSDTQLAERMSADIESGNVFINDIVKSDARLPFGGVKKSGFGRELSEYGLKEFVNVKTVYIH